jgi:DNA-binding response OmpR family regulator
MRRTTRILVVDDMAADGRRLARALRDAGYEVAVCTSSPDAVRVAGTFRPDLVMLEMGGQGEGPALARRLRADSDPLLLFVTRDGSVSGRLAAFDTGADDVVKPYVIEELLARVHAVLRRAGRQTSQVNQVGRLLVDESGHRVLVGDREIDLGPTDFALLATLARHPGRVWSKRLLLELVWGYDAVDENVVEVHISILRRRLGAGGAHLIQTVRGVGYVLRDS